MKFLALIVLFLVCGAYYDHTTEQKQIDDQATLITSLEADNQKLTDEKMSLTQDVAAAQAKAKVLSDKISATSAIASAAPTMAADQVARAIVFISGDTAQGTGFLVKMPDGPAVVTNLHVIANNPNLKILTSNGAVITPLGLKGASDRDLAMFSIPDANFTYLPLSNDVSGTAQPGDDVVTPGNSEGGNVVLNTTGKVIALGPDRIEFSNPVYHGNSGGPVFGTKGGVVLAVVTEGMKVDVNDDLDKASFQSRNSAITSSIRYFGLRLDTVSKWEPYNIKQFQNETAFLDQFHKQSRSLDSYLNSGDQGQVAQGNGNNKLYLNDEKIMTAHNNFRRELGGADTTSQLDALRQLGFDLNTIADRDMEAIQNLNNFYSFDQQQARDEIAYRKALKKEIQSFSGDVNRISSLPRSNN